MTGVRRSRRLDKRKLTQSDMTRMNIPELHWKTRIKFIPESVAIATRNYLLELDRMLEKGVGLLITGSRGVGKTSLATIVLKEARSVGYTCYFGSVWEVREKIKNKILFAGETLMLDRCREVDFLALDDLGAEDARDFIFGTKNVVELIKYRAGRGKVTLITSRLDMDEEDKSILMNETAGLLVTLDVTGPDLLEKRQDLLHDMLFKGSDKE
jgi:DNA replication protein DnaC